MCVFVLVILVWVIRELICFLWCFLMICWVFFCFGDMVFWVVRGIMLVFCFFFGFLGCGVDGGMRVIGVVMVVGWGFMVVDVVFCCILGMLG